MENISIEMITRKFAPSWDGSAVSGTLPGELIRNGCKAELLTLNNVPRLEEDIVDGCPVLWLPWSEFAENMDAVCIAMMRFLEKRKDRFNIFHCCSLSGYTLAALLAAKRTGRKFLFKIDKGGCQGELDLFLDNFFGREAFSLLQEAEAFVTTNTDMKNLLLANGVPTERLSLIPEGVDEKYFMRQGPYCFPRMEEPFRFLMIGLRQQDTGTDIAIEAAAILQSREIRPFTVEMYDDGDFETDSHFRKLIAEKKVESVVSLNPSAPDRRALYERSHAYLLVSRADGLSTTMLEAMSMEIPVISTKVSGSIDVLTNGREALMVDVGKPEQLADAMEKLMKEEALAGALGNCGRKRILEGYTLSGIAAQYMALYKKLLEGTAK